MFIIINGVKIPFQEDKDLEPIFINAAVAENCNSRWLGEISFELDEGADTLTIPLDVLKQLGISPKANSEPVIAEMADGTETKELQMKLSLRIVATNGEIITLHEVLCICPPAGTCLMGRNVLQVFRKTVTQNKLQEFILNPKTRTYLGLINE
jgi:hypothetical protein